VVVAPRADRAATLLSRVLLAAGLVGVAWASLLRPESLPGEVALVSDKVLHFVGYAVLGALAIASGLRAIVAVAALLAFGLLLEVAQLVSGYRSFEWADLAADGAGAVIGILAARAIKAGWRARSGS
jgi:VanZ family protein